jgi:hypothetical protein
MKYDDLIRIFCKTFGLYFVILAAINIKDVIFYGLSAQFVDSTFGSSFYLFAGGQTYNFVFNVMAAWILITKTEFVSRRILKGGTGVFELNVNKSDLIELVIIAIGILLIVNAVPVIFSILANYIPLSRLDKEEYWSNRNQQDIFYSIFKFLVGLVTVSNGRLIARRLTKIGDRSDQIENDNGR